MIFVGLLPAQREVMRGRKRLWQEAMDSPLPQLPPMATFSPKFDLPKLDCYRGELKASYWAKWLTRKMTRQSKDKSWVSASALRDLATKAGLRDQGLVDRVCHRLQDGADTGTMGRGRLPTNVRNSPTLYENGYAVSDSLQEGIVDGYLSGPYNKEELVELLGPDYTVNPMGIKPKPNGKLRMIVDASSPHDEDESVPGWLWNPELPGSVNSTIDMSRFPARMSSVAKFVRTLYRVGRGALVCKIDWSSAYKHQHVRKEDLKLQVMEWGGRLFEETRLMFGTRSSPGIYDDLHKCFLYSVIELSPGMTRNDVEQHLDDVLGVGPEGEDSPVHGFFRKYKEEAAAVGIKLDKSGNRDKVQPPDTVCVALGVEFDMVAWTWRYKKDKLSRILHTLHNIVQGEERWSTVGSSLLLANSSM